MMTIEQQVNEANRRVMDILLNGRPVWTDVCTALDVIPGMTKETILVAGPPLPADRITPPIRTSICGAAVHEGLAADADEAWNMVLQGRIRIEPAQNHACGCAACMVVSASMPVLVAQDPVFGGKGYAPIHPGSNPKVLRWGLYDEEVERDLQWMRDDFGPALGQAVRASGGIDLVTVLAKTAGMGDENHNRQPAASMYLALQVIPHFLGVQHPQKNDMIRFLAENDRFFLHVMMAGVEALTVKAKEIPLSTVMAGMGGNGVTFGIQLAGTGDCWFTAPAPVIRGMLLKPSYTEDDLLGYLGDSCVTEVYGLGGMSSIAGPAYARFTGATFAEAKDRTEKARAVSLGEHTFAPIPWDDFRGFPVGIDARKVVGYNILPVSHGGSALKTGGQGGAGAAELPLECFREALRAVRDEALRAQKEEE